MQAIGENTVLAQRYTLTRKLAQRADQQLWIATDTTLRRDVTATLFPADSPHAEAALDSARRAAGVEDHHLPRVLDVGTEDGTAYVISEALHGAESIAAALQFETLPAEEARRLVGESASGLGAAAARGLHHLQLTPHDIVCTPDGAVSVLGLPTDAALAGAEELSSEQASRADTVALVQILYAALTGHWPGEESVPGLPDASRRADGELPAPGELADGVPGDLDTLCRTTLGEDAGPHTPTELARQLAPWSSERVTARAKRATGTGRHAGPALAPIPGADAGSDATSREQPADGDRDDAAESPARGLAAPLPRRTASGSDSADTARDGDETTHLPTADLKRARERAAEPVDDYDDDYDPSFTELESPVPGIGGHFEPDRRSSRLALAIVALLVVIAVVFAAIGLRGIGRSAPAASGSSSSPGTSRSGTSSTTASATSKPKPSAKPLTITRVTSYGIGGGENSGLARNATDNDPSTYWNSNSYRGPVLQQGTGLLLNLGSVQDISKLTITTTGSASDIQIFVSEQQEPVSSRKPTKTLSGKGTQSVDLSGTSARFITIWVTKLSKQDDGTFQERINDVKVYP